MSDDNWLLGEDAPQGIWIEWRGGDSGTPLPPESMVFAKGRDGKEYRTLARRLRWDHIGNGGDIMSFQITKPQLDMWHEWDCEWNEGYSPVPGDYKVEIKFRDGGDTHTCAASNLIWGECNESTIVEYRIVEAP